MEERKTLDSQGLIDSLITDCNSAVKVLANGQYIAWCNLMVQMVQKLARLKTGISNDLKDREEQIKELKELSEVRARTIESLMKKEGDKDGSI